MRKYEFFLVNVFAETNFGGNPLAVFPDAQGLSDDEMQLIAAQFNLSETVFAMPSENAAATLRIFTPSYELPLAGHPTLGAALILQQKFHLPAHFVLQTKAKPVDIHIQHNIVYLSLNGYHHKPSSATSEELSDALGIASEYLAETAYWINSGSPQLLLEIKNLNALHHAQANYLKLSAICNHQASRAVIYLWHDDGQTIHSRLFAEQNNSLIEDSGTGSAAANLGAYFVMKKQHPLQRTIHQGDHLNRPNRLYLEVDKQETIQVGGKVITVGNGIFTLPT